MPSRWVRASCALGTFLVLAWPAPVWAQALPQEQPAPSNDDCLMCHGDASAVREDGRSIAVLPDVFATSAHGALGMACVDCHTALATFTDWPHPPQLPRPDCATCHGDAVSGHAGGVHARQHADGRPFAGCVDCHGMHDIRPSRDPLSRTHQFNVAGTCGTCHVAGGAAGTRAVTPTFTDSIHGRALAGGVAAAPTCATCHGAHDVRTPTDPASPVHRLQVSDTCATCHDDVRQVHERGVHYRAMQAGNALAPTCTGCHTAHAIVDTAAEAWQLDVIRECGTCHGEALRTYRDTFHGKVTQLGFTRVAKCADCHGAHDILPAADSASRISPARRLETCQTCHPRANANFARYDPHPDPLDRHRSPALYYTSVFMQVLLGGVFVFFGAHTLLWFPRSWRARRERDAAERAARAEE